MGADSATYQSVWYIRFQSNNGNQAILRGIFERLPNMCKTYLHLKYPNKYK